MKKRKIQNNIQFSLKKLLIFFFHLLQLAGFRITFGLSVDYLQEQ